MAKAATTDRSPRAGGGARSIFWLSGLACGVLAAMAPGLAILGAGLLAPGFVALKLDREPGRPMARTVLTCGLAACVHPVVMLWNSGHSMGAAIAIVSDPAVAGITWGAAAAGWLMTQLAPLFVRTVLEAAALGRVTRLRTLRGRLVETWGLDQVGPDQGPGA